MVIIISGDHSGSGLTIGPNAWLKRKLHLRPQHRGVHLVTEEILAGLPELSQFQVSVAIIHNHSIVTLCYVQSLYTVTASDCTRKNLLAISRDHNDSRNDVPQTARQRKQGPLAKTTA